MRDDITRNDVARLYPLWLWAHVSGEGESHARDHFAVNSARSFSYAFCSKGCRRLPSSPAATAF